MSVSLMEPLVHAARPWSDLYGDSAFLQTGLLFVHFAGLLAAGGFAVATDRLALRIGGTPGRDRAVLLRELAAVHRPVMIGLVVVTITGIGMALADAEYLLTSAVFWLKMGAFALLLGNGLLMLRAERRLRAGADRAASPPVAGSSAPATPERAGGWSALRWAALRSVALWTLTLLLGTTLTAI